MSGHVFWRRTLVAAVCSLSFSSFHAAAESDQMPALSGTEWVVSEISGQSVNGRLATRIHFNAGRVSGLSGCNQFVADYQQGAQKAQGETRFSVSDLNQTRKICFATLMHQEQRLLRVLTRADSARINAGKRLILATPQGRTLVLTPADYTAELAAN